VNERVDQRVNEELVGVAMSHDYYGCLSVMSVCVCCRLQHVGGIRLTRLLAMTSSIARHDVVGDESWIAVIRYVCRRYSLLVMVSVTQILQPP
jgi:hypothetical protein